MSKQNRNIGSLPSRRGKTEDSTYGSCSLSRANWKFVPDMKLTKLLSHQTSVVSVATRMPRMSRMPSMPREGLNVANDVGTAPTTCMTVQIIIINIRAQEHELHASTRIDRFANQELCRTRKNTFATSREKTRSSKSLQRHPPVIVMDIIEP